MDKGLQLINLVKSYEFLYNLDSPLYNNTLKKEDTWNKIGEQLNLSGQQCHKRWNNMRDTYKKIRNRKYKNRQNRNAQSSESEEVEKGRPWKYEELLKFLDNVQSCRRYFFQKSTLEREQDDNTQQTSFSQTQSIDVSDEEVDDDDDLEIKEELILSDRATYITPDNNPEIEDELITSDPLPCIESLPIPLAKKPKINNYTNEYNTTKSDGGIFYVTVPQNVDAMDGMPSSTLQNFMPNTIQQTLPLMQPKTNNIFQSTTLGYGLQNTSEETFPQTVDDCLKTITSIKGLQIKAIGVVPQQLPPPLLQKKPTVVNCIPNVGLQTFSQMQPNVVNSLQTKVNLPEKPQNLNNCLESSTGLQIVAVDSIAQPTPPSPPPQPQNKQLEDSCFQTETISETKNQILNLSDNSSEDFQFSPVSYATSTPPQTPTLPLSKQEYPEIDILYEKYENFLESATTALKELQQKSSNATVILFESLARKIGEANITKRQINEIEHEVCMLVFTKLSKYMAENNAPR